MPALRAYQWSGGICTVGYRPRLENAGPSGLRQESGPVGSKALRTIPALRAYRCFGVLASVGLAPTAKKWRPAGTPAICLRGSRNRPSEPHAITAGCQIDIRAA
jgi:hypothetical protein